MNNAGFSIRVPIVILLVLVLAGRIDERTIIQSPGHWLLSVYRVQDFLRTFDFLLVFQFGFQFKCIAASSGNVIMALAASVAASHGCAAGEVSGRFYRKNASVKPPSTGMMCPVVLPLSSLASHRMAFAQSIGRIGRRVRVRWA
jgi:hypothetical protein